MPSAKALRPTIALLYCTGKEVAAYTTLRRGQLRGVDLVPVRKLVVPHIDRHHDLFQRGIAGRSPMPLTVHSTVARRRRCRLSELATAMPRSLWQCTEKIALSEFGTRSIKVRMKWVYSRHVTDGVGIPWWRRLDDGFDDPAQIVHLAAGAVLGRPFDVVDLVAGAGNHGNRGPMTSSGSVQLGPHVQRRGRDHGVDAAAAGELHGLGAASMLPDGRGQPAMTEFWSGGRSRRPPGVAFRGDVAGLMTSTPISSSNRRLRASPKVMVAPGTPLAVAGWCRK